MKRPFLNQYERQMIIHDTLHGAMLNVGLQIYKLKREIRRNNNCITAYLLIRKFNRIKLTR